MPDLKFFDEYFTVLEWPRNLRLFILSELSSRKGWHGIGHHALMLTHIKNTNGTSALHYISSIAAALFHDIVYDPFRNDNEEMSAASAKLWIPNNPMVDMEFVVDAILQTKKHVLFKARSERDIAIQLFLRADLMILWSRHPNQYRFYAHGVRTEYRHVPNEQYRAGRAAVLIDLREKILPYLKRNEAAQLKKNIDWELAELQKGTFDV